jgi:hypothetical protein
MRRLLLLFALLFTLGSAAAAPSIGGTPGFWTNCRSANGVSLSQGSDARIWVSYYSNDAASLELACIAQYQIAYKVSRPTSTYVLTFLGCSGLATCEYNVNYTSSTGSVSDFGTYRDTFVAATLPANASCTSGVFDANVNACLGGTAACSSGESKDMTLLLCLGKDTYEDKSVNEPNCREGSKRPILLKVAFEGCQYEGPTDVTYCWQSRTSGNMYCAYTYVSNGYGAGSADAPVGVTADSAPENKCTKPGGCSGVAMMPMIVPASDGTAGGYGAVSCGGTGQPTCQNGVVSGTTACGGAGQPACPAESSTYVAGSGSGSDGGGGSACGGDGQPSCQVSNKDTDEQIKKIGDFLTGTVDEPVAPDAPAANDLAAAGLDGGTKVGELLAWRVPAHASVCPAGSFSLFGKQVAVNTHCDLVDSVKGTMRNLMTLVFGLGALFIVLRA